MSFTRAVAARPEDVVVTTGAQQAFDLLARILVTPGRTLVALEDPGYPPLRAAFRAAGARLVPVPVDAEGLVVARVPRAAGIVCVTPSHQFPLGTAMSIERRTALLALAQARGLVVIEDDYDSEFRFGGRPLEALQTLDRSASVFYVGTFSKSLSPLLRTGFVVAPPWARDALVAAKRASDGENPPLPQEALALLIAEGHLARHVRRMRRVQKSGAARSSSPAWRATSAAHSSRWPRSRGCTSRRGCRRGATRTTSRRGPPTTASASCRCRPSTPGAPARGSCFGYGASDEATIAAGLTRLKSLWRR